MRKNAAAWILAALTAFCLPVEEGAAQKLIGQHPGTVWRTALSSDGELLAAGDTNGLVKLWNAETGEQVSTLGAYQNEVDWLTFWADDRYLVSSSFLVARIWDMETGKTAPVSNMIGYYGVIALSPDHRTVAASKRAEQIFVWDVETGEEKAAIEMGSEYLRSLVFAHDGRLLAGAGKEGVSIWDVETAQLKTRFKTPVDARDQLLRPSQYRIAFLPDNRSIASLSHTKYDQQNHAVVHVWDVETGQKQLDFGEDLTFPRFALDGSVLAAYEGGKARLWDLKTGEELAAFEEGFRRPVFSADSRLMAVPRYNEESDARTLQIWDMETRKLLSVIESGDQRLSLFSPNPMLSSNGLLTIKEMVSYRETEFTRWDIQGGAATQFLVGASSEIASLSFSPDGRSVASSCANGWITDYAVRIWDVSTGEEKRHISAYRGPSAFSPDGRTVACVGHGYAIGVWNAETGEKVAELNDYSPTSFAYSPDGKTLAFNNSAANQQGLVRFLDISTGEAADAFTSPSGRASELAFSQDGTVLAAAGRDGSVHLWNVETKEILRTVKSGGSVSALALSPSGGSIAVGGEDSMVRVWSVRNGALRAKMVGHEGPVHDVAYSPDGRRIASAGEDGTARIWSAKTFALEKTLTEHDAWVNAVAFSPDSRSLISGGKDGRILLWRLGDQPVLWSDVKRPNSPLFKTALLPTYPNPFNPETWIPFDLAHESAVTIVVYNSAGRTVRRLELGELPPGSYRAKGKAAYWDGRDALGAPAASGVYFVRIEAGGYTETRRMVLLK